MEPADGLAAVIAERRCIVQVPGNLLANGARVRAERDGPAAAWTRRGQEAVRNRPHRMRW